MGEFGVDPRPLPQTNRTKHPSKQQFGQQQQAHRYDVLPFVILNNVVPVCFYRCKILIPWRELSFKILTEMLMLFVFFSHEHFDVVVGCCQIGKNNQRTRRPSTAGSVRSMKSMQSMQSMKSMKSMQSIQSMQSQRSSIRSKEEHFLKSSRSLTSNFTEPNSDGLPSARSTRSHRSNRSDRSQRSMHSNTSRVQQQRQQQRQQRPRSAFVR